MSQHTQKRRRRRSRRRPSRPIGPVKACAVIAVAGAVLLAVAHLASARRDLLLARTQLQTAREALVERALTL